MTDIAIDPTQWPALKASARMEQLRDWATGDNYPGAVGGLHSIVTQGLATCANAEERWWLHRLGVEVTYYRGELKDCLTHVDAASTGAAHVQTTADARMLVLHFHGMVLARYGDTLGGLELGHQLRGLAQTPRQIAFALRTLSMAHFAHRSLDRACELMRECIALCEAHAVPRLAFLARNTLVGFEHIRGDVSGALALAQAQVETAKTLPHVWSVMARSQLASLLTASGRHAEACAHAADVLTEKAFGKQNRYTTQCTLAEALTGLGQYTRARQLLTRTIADYVASGEQSFRWFMHEALADCCARLGDFEAAYREQKAARKWFAANVNRQSSGRFEALDSHYRISLAEAEARQLRDDNVALQAAAHTDALTGLPNRRVLYDVLRERCAAGLPMGVLVIDADHFKRVNDLFSHLVGDTVLTRLAHIFTQMLRTDDLIARFGGEEFVGVVALDVPQQAFELAERLRAAVEAAPWSEVALGLTVTVSVGVAHGQPGERANDVLARADACLLRAKTSGRNRVIADR